MIEIREYRQEDCPELAELFYQTVHSVNAGDYTKEQLDVWADGRIDMEVWNQSFLSHYTLVATVGDIVAGFGDIDDTGYLDRLYIHKDYQRNGIAAFLCDKLENRFAVKHVTTHASITARPFFEKRGYKVLREQQVERKGIKLTNYVMRLDKN